MRIGIVRPLPNWDKKGLDKFDPILKPNFMSERWGRSTFNYFSIMVGKERVGNFGKCFWSDWVNSYKIITWDGMEDAFFQDSDEIGMLLDLDAGTLSIYKNGRRLGTMLDGLSGEYCWTATMWDYGDSVRIEKGSIPTD